MHADKDVSQSDRIVVIYKGEFVAILDAQTATMA
jgi:ABC-type uncharacterized transport system ATPase subunit